MAGAAGTGQAVRPPPPITLPLPFMLGCNPL